MGPREKTDPGILGPLTAAQVVDFYERGYFVLESLFSLEEVARISDCFDRLQKMGLKMTYPQTFQGSYFVVNGSKIDRIVWCGGAEPSLLDISADARLTGPAAQLLESALLQQLICQAHFKLPKDGVGFGWHQDSEHRRYGTFAWDDRNGKGSYVQTILAVDEMNQENGPLMLVPGSCQRGHVNLTDTRQWDEITQPQGIQALHMKPGSVLFMGPYTVHGSLPNKSTNARRVFINGYAYPGANKRAYPGRQAGRLLKVD